MARPIKQGLDYYSMDTNFIHDIKVRKIMRSNGPQSIAVLLDLLGTIYGDHGYYMQWDDDVRFLISDDVGVSELAVDELINKAVKVGFFDQALFDEFSILTSHGIQKRYKQGSKRKAGYGIQKSYDLLVNVDNNSSSSGVSVYNNPAKEGVSAYNNRQSKVNKSKGKETKVNNTSVSDSESVSDDPFERKHNEFLVDVWPKFPRQLNQDATYEAYYNALLEGATKQEIIAGIEKYAEWVKLNGVQQSYIKGSQKYMEERRWTDNYDLTAPQDSMTGKPRTKGDWVDD